MQIINMSKKFILYILAFIISAQSIAQNPLFVVYSKKGNPEYIFNNQTKSIITGTQINSNSLIKLNNNESVVLVCENYKTIILNKAGSYNANQITENCKKQNKDLTSSYFKYIWEEFSHPHTTPDENHKKFMKTTGAVSRGCYDSTILPIIDSIKIVKNKFHWFQWNFVWMEPEGKPELKLQVFDDRLFGRKIIDSTVQFPEMDLSKLFKNLPTGDYYWLLTQNPTKPCERNYVGIYSEKEFDTVMAEIKSKVLSYDDASENFMTGYLLEQKNFLLEAQEYYKKAVKLNPNNTLYSNRLKVFLKNYFNQ